MKTINKTRDNSREIESLYEQRKVECEQTHLISDSIEYPINYFPKQERYHVTIFDFKCNDMLSDIYYFKLSNSTLRYFNLVEGDVFSDSFGNTFKCKKHVVKFNCI